MPDIEVYYADLCGLCHEAMDFFRDNGIPFTAHRLEWDRATGAFKDSAASRELHRRCGRNVDFVPQFFIGGEWVSGWKSLKPMIESGEFERMMQREGGASS